MKKTVVVIDGGGRGSVLVEKYSQNPKVGKIIAIPGNDMMQINTKKRVLIFSNVKTTDINEIIRICKRYKADFVDVAQENAFEKGLTDRLIKEGFNTFGPTKNASQLEWDKAWAREFMKKYNIPCPKFYIFNNQKSGINFLKKQKNKKWFVKASGLCEGKGALPSKNNNEGIENIKKLKKFGDAAKTYLIEDWIEGKSTEEFSAFAISDGLTYKILGYAQDHKRALDFDEGENTGGMGCVSNPLIVNKSIKNQAEKIIRKTFIGMKKEKREFRGILYIGGIVVDGKVFVIEYNTRWGDPEAQVIIPGIKNDFFSLSLSVSNQELNKQKIKIDNKKRLSTAGCVRGYPGDYSKNRGKKIFGIYRILKTPGVSIFGAGTKKIGKNFTVNGGRVLHIVGEGKDVLEARGKAYYAMSQIFIEGNNLHFRKDIGYHDVERLIK